MTSHTENPPEDTAAADSEASVVAAAAGTRKRPKPGERRVQILQTLASMLEQPGAERITTAALAAQARRVAKRRCTATSPARRRCSRG